MYGSVRSVTRLHKTIIIIILFFLFEASKFIEKFFDGDVEGLSHPSLAIFSQLCSSASCIGQDPVSTQLRYSNAVFLL